MKVRITTKEFFKGEQVGGLEFGDWLALNNEGKLKQRLSFIASRAGVLGSTVYDDDCGLPGNVIGDAQVLHQKATQALEAANDRDFLTAATMALDVGLLANDLNRQMAAYAGLKVRAEAQKPRSEGGKATAELRRENQQRKMEVVAQLWKKLAEEGRPERDRAGIIARRNGQSIDTVRRWIKKAGLR